MEGVASSPAQIKREARGSLQLRRPGLLAAPAAAHLLPAFNSQPPHGLGSEQAVKRSTVTGSFPPVKTARRVLALPASLQFLHCRVFPQILTQDTHSQLSTRLFWKRGEDWRSI